MAVALSLMLTFRPESQSTVLAPYIMGALLIARGIGLALANVRGRTGAGSCWPFALAMMVPVTAIARAFGSIDMLPLCFMSNSGPKARGLVGSNAISRSGLCRAGRLSGGDRLCPCVSGPEMDGMGGGSRLVLANPVLRGAVAMALPMAGDRQDSLMSHFVEPAIVPAAGDPAPDVIIVYLEGMDRIFDDRHGSAMRWTGCWTLPGRDNRPARRRADDRHGVEPVGNGSVAVRCAGDAERPSV